MFELSPSKLGFLVRDISPSKLSVLATAAPFEVWRAIGMAAVAMVTTGALVSWKHFAFLVFGGKTDDPLLQQCSATNCDGFVYGKGSCFRPPPEVLEAALQKLSEVEYNTPAAEAAKPRYTRVYHNRRKTAWTDYPLDPEGSSEAVCHNPEPPSTNTCTSSVAFPAQGDLIDLLKTSPNLSGQRVREVVSADVKTLGVDRISDVLKATDSNGWSPLLIAVQRKQTVAVGALLELGADIECKEPVSKWTPLMYAAMAGNKTMVQQLLSHGAAVNVCVAQRSWSPLCAAIQSGDAEVVRMLMRAGADFQALKRNHPDLAETYRTDMQ